MAGGGAIEINCGDLKARNEVRERAMKSSEEKITKK